MIKDHLSKDNLHHAYLIEGEKEEILAELFDFMAKIGIKTSGNPDFCVITLDSFRIEDARNLKSFGSERSISPDLSREINKKIFIISVNNFLLEAQGTLLKIFEEPIENTHFFLIVPDAGILLPTLVSRFYLIKHNSKKHKELTEVQNFISLPLKDRISFIKDLISEEDFEDNENVNENSARTKANKFLDSLEFLLQQKIISDENNSKNKFLFSFDQIFKVREFLRQPGSSVKSLMESIAVVIPRL